MDRNLALEFVRVTEAGAIAAAHFIGKGDKNAADDAAVQEMRSRFSQIDFCGEVVIGEGEKDEAPMLFTGEKFCLHTRNGSPIPADEHLFDIAVDPLECTDSVAYGRYNALSVIVVGSRGSLLKAPDVYMDKVAVGPKAKDFLHSSGYRVLADMPVSEFLTQLATVLGKPIQQVTVVLLDRPRHEQLISGIRAVGGRVRLLTDGDVAGAIAPSLDDSDIDCLLGVGASTEAVLAAGALRSLGGAIAVRFAPKDDQQKQKISQYANLNLDTVYFTEDLASGEYVTFTATGVMDGPLLNGVTVHQGTIATHSVVMRAKSGTVRFLETKHLY